MIGPPHAGGTTGLPRLALACIAFVIGAASWSISAAQSDSESRLLERRVKAAFLYKFAGFVEWPEGFFARPDTPITIGIVGDDTMAAELVPMTNGRTVAGRPIAIKKLHDEDPSSVHILFVGRTETARLNEWRKRLETQSVLIVTESEGALRQGSTINFLVSGGRVRFEIALDGVEKRGIKISSRLLSVAQYVQTGTAP